MVCARRRTLYTFESVSPVAGVTRFGTLGALTVVIIASLLSEGLQDLTRFRQDTKMNAKPCQVLVDGAWATVRWRDVKVGDFVRVLQDEAFPADFLVLASDNRAGRCYIETASLDGETNLKVYGAPSAPLAQHLFRAFFPAMTADALLCSCEEGGGGDARCPPGW